VTPSASATAAISDDGALDVRRDAPDRAVLALSGGWLSRRGVPDAAAVARTLQSGAPLRTLAFDTRAITAWDSSDMPTPSPSTTRPRRP